MLAFFTERNRVNLILTGKGERENGDFYHDMYMFVSDSCGIFKWGR